MSTCCTDQPFPEVAPAFSLTNHIEIIRVDNICSPRPNQFNMLPYTSNKTLRQLFAPLDISPSNYSLYRITSLNPFKTVNCDFTDYPEQFAIYFAISAIIICLNDSRLYQIWLTNSSYNNTVIQFPIQMPSRFATFRA
jgi:hypothetical protein